MSRASEIFSVVVAKGKAGVWKGLGRGKSSKEREDQIQVCTCLRTHILPSKY